MNKLRDLTEEEFENFSLFITLDGLGFGHPAEVEEEEDKEELKSELINTKEGLRDSVVLGAYDNERGTYILWNKIYDDWSDGQGGEAGQDKFVHEYFIEKDHGAIYSCGEWDAI